MAPQYCGAVGKVTNSQGGGYLGYASTKGATLLDGQLFVPEPWFADDHAELRTATGMPADLTFQTKPEFALALLQRSRARKDLAARLPKEAWIRAEIKDGSKGPIVCDLTSMRVTEARNGLPGPRLWLVIGRSLNHPTDVRYYLSNAPETTVLAAMVGWRWPVELIFETGKGELGMDHYEVRSWAGWHQHMVLLMLAHHLLVWVQRRWQQQALALTLHQVLLFTAVLPKPVFDAARALEIVRYYQRRNHAAAVSHRKRALARLKALDFAL